MPPAIQVRQGHSHAQDEVQAVRELAEQIGREQEQIVLFFCSSNYDMPKLGRALKAGFPGLVIGCSSSGQIGPGGYMKGGISAASFQGGRLRARTYLIDDLKAGAGTVKAMASDIRQRAVVLAQGWKRFGFLLVDGLSLAEEWLTSEIYTQIGSIPIVGASAGDDLAFEKTWVYHEGLFLDASATFSLFETDLPFQTFKFQHFVPTDTKLVITEAQPEKRLVTEINGLPAAEAYASAIGKSVRELNAQVFSKHPLLLRLGEDHYIRSIKNLEADLSLSFLCAIEVGMVLSAGQGVDIMQAVDNAFATLHKSIADPSVVIGFDCILRRIEMEEDCLDRAVGQALARNRVFGFSTYGEQFNALHVNQTFTGIAIGGQP